MNIAIILAGGVGVRFGAKDTNGQAVPKQFVEVLGKPVLAYTIEVFQNANDIDCIEVVCVSDYIDVLRSLVIKYHFSKVKWIVPGGPTFQRSVINGIYYLEGKIKADDIVMTHFGASPFIDDSIISDAIRVAKEKGNAISSTDFYLLPGIKKTTFSVSDSSNCSSQYINRDTIACMNSPHAFRFSFIDDLYHEAGKTGILSTAEPHTTSLMYKMGRTIYFSKGSQTNIKITTKDDLLLFEGYCLAKKSQE